MEEAAVAAAAANENGNEDQINNSEKSWEKSDREFLMVVATFIATMAFQAGINPPGGVWQDDDNLKSYEAGKSIMATKSPTQFVSFIATVTVCMACSLIQLVVLLNELPYKKLSVSRNFLIFTMGSALSSMAWAYWSSVTALTPEPLMSRVVTTFVVLAVFSGVCLAILICVQRRKRGPGVS